jgi:uncharacterized protein YoxC
VMRPAINGSIFGEDSLRLDENPRERERSAEPQFVGRKQLILLWIFVSITFVLIIGLGAFAYKAWRDAQQLRYDTARITQEIQANLRQETEAIRTSLGPILQTAKHADQTAAELKGSLEELANSHQGLSDQVRRLAQRVRQEEKQAPADDQHHHRNDISPGREASDSATRTDRRITVCEADRAAVPEGAACLPCAGNRGYVETSLRRW